MVSVVSLVKGVADSAEGAGDSPSPEGDSVGASLGPSVGAAVSDAGALVRVSVMLVPSSFCRNIVGYSEICKIDLVVSIIPGT